MEVQGRVLEGEWRVSCLASALKFDCHMTAGCMCKLPIRHRDSRKEICAASRPETGRPGRESLQILTQAGGQADAVTPVQAGDCPRVVRRHHGAFTHFGF